MTTPRCWRFAGFIEGPHANCPENLWGLPPEGHGLKRTAVRSFLSFLDGGSLRCLSESQTG